MRSSRTQPESDNAASEVAEMEIVDAERGVTLMISQPHTSITISACPTTTTIGQRIYVGPAHERLTQNLLHDN